MGEQGCHRRATSAAPSGRPRTSPRVQRFSRCVGRVSSSTFLGAPRAVSFSILPGSSPGLYHQTAGPSGAGNATCIVYVTQPTSGVPLGGRCRGDWAQWLRASVVGERRVCAREQRETRLRRPPLFSCSDRPTWGEVKECGWDGEACHAHRLLFSASPLLSLPMLPRHDAGDLEPGAPPPSYPDQNVAAHPPPLPLGTSSPQHLEPWLGLRARLFLCLASYGLVALLFVGTRLVISASEVDNEVQRSNDSLWRACRETEQSAMSLASFPHLLADNFNSATKRSVDDTVHGLGNVLLLS